MQKSIFGLLLTIIISTNAYAQNWDINLLKDINPQNPSSSYWQKASSTTYAIGVGVPATQLIVGFIKKDKKLQNQGWETIGGLAINSIVTFGLKYSINRERPYDKYPLLINPYKIEDSRSFPSGHTSTAFSVATSLSLQYKKWYVVVPAYVWASSVGYSRLYLGEHYPSDVLVGAAVGAGSAWLSNYLNKKYFSKKKH
ncbi:MAG: phosphatase PAP2 family protein [Pedobacter sp.]|nr:phosphatase PAP2 family protein [Chitinophagaceae bacterium]